MGLSRANAVIEEPHKFGDRVAADSLLAEDAEEGIGIDEASCALVLLDRGADYLDAFPMRHKTAESCAEAFFEFAGPTSYISELYTDDAPELIKAAKGCK